jgi:putative membrane protein
MNLLSQVFAGATALALIAVGLLEIFFHGDRRFYRIFLIKPEDVPAVRMWAMNIGAYNITFGLGIASGLWMVNFSGNAAMGSAIVVFCCASQFILGIWLWITEKRLLISAIGQALGPGLVLVFYLLFR